jgi:hypothetical protein
MLDIAHFSPRKKQSSTSNLLLGCGCATASCNQREDFTTLEPPYMNMKNPNQGVLESDGEGDIDIPISSRNLMQLDPKLRVN